MKIKSVKQAKINNSDRVLLRTDYNVALDKKGRVDANEIFRLERTIPTIKHLVSKRARVIILTHLGRPSGRFEKKFSNKPLALSLGKILGKPVKMLPGVIEPGIRNKIDALKPGQVILLENLRFYPGEDKNSNDFAKSLASLGDVYVNDAFASIHRESASLLGITNFLPSYAGLLLESEIANLSQLVLSARPPLLFLMGGAKVETKLPFIKKLLPKAEKILLGGVLANTVLKSKGMELGSSFYDKKMLKPAADVYSSRKIILPSDVICDRSETKKVESTLRDVQEIQKNEMVIDIGTTTAVRFAQEIRRAKTVFFNGPLGLTEKKEGRHGSEAIAEMLAALSASGKIKSIVGGGETINLFSKLGLLNDITYVSTGGGALFAFLINQKLPVLKPLIKK